MKRIHLEFESIGTHWIIDIHDAPTRLSKTQISDMVKGRIDEFDKVYSRFRPDSLITKIAHESGTYPMPPDFPPLYDLYHRLYTLTNGAFTPLIGNALVEAGYDADYSLKSRPIQPVAKWEDVMEYKNPDLVTHVPALLDYGAGGKGYLVDLIGELLEKNDIHHYCIDAGGDILYKANSDKALTIGLENPKDLKTVIGTVELKNQSICGSAINRRAWGEYHHIMNPHTMRPVEDIIATWCVADSGLLADSLATALFFVDPSYLAEFKYEYVIVRSDMSVHTSPDFPGTLFTS